jgi:hypothetical protein
VTVTVDPPSEVNNIQLQRGGTGSTRVKLQNQVRHADGTITVDIYGQIFSPGNLVVSDCLLWAVYVPTSTVLAYDPIWVVIPRAIGVPHPTANGGVGPVNQLATAATSPAYFGTLSPGFVVLWTYWAQWLPIPVVDQFNKPLDSLYNGQPVEENSNGAWRPINQNVGGGTYQDPVFVFQYKNNQANAYIVPAGSPEAVAWPGAPPASFPIVTSPQEIPVRVAGHELGRVEGTTIVWPATAIHNRTVISTAPNNVQVTWP